MAAKKKILLLLPDGVGLRNFAYTDFYSLAKERNFDIVFWNNTPIDLSRFGFDAIPMENEKSHPLTQILKIAKTRIELDINIAKSKDAIYESYYFPPSAKGWKNKLKNWAIKLVTNIYSSEKGLVKLRKRIASLERKTLHYKNSRQVLESRKPDFVFCTNQRHVAMIAPVLAAQDLGIPTATFIFSWDNLPKGTLVLETDSYFVWSAHMKAELLYYYPFITENQVYITGTPQFEPHFDPSNINPRETFFAAHRLDPDKKYICFSGDDETTSPDDPQYLADTAAAVRKLNEKGENLGIVFRRCPVDFSPRYDSVLQKYQDIITSIAPDWVVMGDKWSAVLPMANDLVLQQNTIAYTEMVINLGSSMVFDYATQRKPCAFINYDVADKSRADWSVDIIYKFIHFRSMPSKQSVLWLNNAMEIGPAIASVISGNSNVVDNAQQWFKKINKSPANRASERILDAFENIIVRKN
jgi:hypothetical protein